MAQIRRENRFKWGQIVKYSIKISLLRHRTHGNINMEKNVRRTRFPCSDWLNGTICSFFVRVMLPWVRCLNKLFSEAFGFSNRCLGLTASLAKILDIFEYFHRFFQAKCLRAKWLVTKYHILGYPVVSSHHSITCFRGFHA